MYHGLNTEQTNTEPNNSVTSGTLLTFIEERKRKKLSYFGRTKDTKHWIKIIREGDMEGQRNRGSDLGRRMGELDVAEDQLINKISIKASTPRMDQIE